MHGFMLTLLICSVTMSALILLYMAVTPLLLKHYHAAGRYYAWLVIVTGLIIPFRPHLSHTFVRLEAADPPAAAAVQTGNMISIAAQGQTISHSPLAGITWWQIMCVIWMAGMLLYLAYHILKHYRFLKLTERWSRTVTNEPVKMLFGSMTDRMGISRSIGLQICDIIGSPMLTGFSGPRILLPNTDYTEAELHFILKHELIHYTRKDLWYKALVLTATAVHWFNPIVHLAAREIGRQCELSCDEAVVNSEEVDTRQYYVETIIGVIRGHSKLRTVFSTNFNGGMKGMKESFQLWIHAKRKPDRSFSAPQLFSH